MKIEDVRAKSQDELRKSLLELRKEHFNLRFQHSNSQLDSSAKLRNVRRDIARVKTVLKELETRSSLSPEKKTGRKQKQKAA